MTGGVLQLVAVQLFANVAALALHDCTGVDAMVLGPGAQVVRVQLFANVAALPVQVCAGAAAR